MEEKPKHQTIIKTTPETEELIQLPVSVLIHSLSYTEELSSEKTEREVNHLTSTYSMLADITDCLRPIKNKETRKLIIEVTADKFYEPKLIKQRYVTNFKDHGRKT